MDALEGLLCSQQHKVYTGIRKKEPAKIPRGLSCMVYNYVVWDEDKKLSEDIKIHTLKWDWVGSMEVYN